MSPKSLEPQIPTTLASGKPTCPEERVPK